jgi:hypothetical protein
MTDFTLCWHSFINNFALWRRNQARNGHRNTEWFVNKYLVEGSRALLSIGRQLSPLRREAYPTALEMDLTPAKALAFVSGD